MMTVRQRENGRASFGGVFRCGGVWVCSECAELAAFARSDELEELADLHLKAERGITFVTATTRHELAHELKPLRQAISKAWTAVLRDGSFRRFGYIAAVRAIESTVGPVNGWHVHVHALVFHDQPLTPEETAQLEEIIFRAWHNSLVRAGFPSPWRYQADETGALKLDENGKPLSLGVVCEPVKAKEAASYLAKMGIALEVTSPFGKAARRGNRSLWEVLNALHDHGRPHDIRIWQEWAAGMKRARPLTWSKRRQLLELYGLEDEEPLTEQQLAVLEAERGDVIAEIHRPIYEHYAPQPGWQPHVLELAEESGGAAVMEFCLQLWLFDGQPVGKYCTVERRRTTWRERAPP